MKGLLESEQVQALANEDSVRGVMVRMALAEAESADAEGVLVLEKSLQLLLGRFQAVEERGS